MLYFSYGSNMSLKRLLERVPSARLVTSATLVGHDLRFHKKGRDGSGKCDAFQTDDPDHRVIGVVYEMNEAEKPLLDEKEGLGHGYDAKRVELLTGSGEVLVAMTYYAIRIDRDLKPYHWYRHHVLTGACENGLPGVYVDGIREIESIMDPDAERHRLEMGIYNGVE